jgi:uncharacterized membrane protein YsdA (DUF1294 family)
VAEGRRGAGGKGAAGKGPVRVEPTIERTTRSDAGNVRPARSRAGSTRREPTVAPAGKTPPVTVARGDGRREPTGRIASVPRSARPAKGAWGVGATVGLFFVVALLLAAIAGRAPAWVAITYTVMSGMTVLWYRLDKSAAVANRRRTPEQTLHLLALFGGWPGALLAQSVFRHKSSKPAFQWAFRMTVLLNLAALAWLLWSRTGMGLDRLLIEGWRAFGLR